MENSLKFQNLVLQLCIFDLQVSQKSYEAFKPLVVVRGRVRHQGISNVLFIARALSTNDTQASDVPSLLYKRREFLAVPMMERLSRDHRRRRHQFYFYERKDLPTF